MFRVSIVCLALVVFVGCQKKLPATIEGTVMLDGRALPEAATTTGEVMFYPTGGGAAAYAPILPGGKYAVSTGGSEGLATGEYKITVRVVEVEPEPPGGYISPPGQKVISPARYQDRDKSDLVRKVEPGKNTINLDLTSK